VKSENFLCALLDFYNIKFSSLFKSFIKFSIELINNDRFLELFSSLNSLLISIWMVGMLQFFEIKFETVVSLSAENIVFVVISFFVCLIYDFKLVFNESNMLFSISERHNKLGFHSHHVPSSIEKSL
jgi:hypothetical protein